MQEIKINIQKKKIFKLTSLQKNKIKKAIEPLDLNLDVDNLFNLIKFFIECRESFKFEFTKNISLALDNLKSFNKNLNENKLKFLSISDFIRLNNKKISFKKIYKKINYNMKLNNISGMTKLPQVLTKKEEFEFFYEFYNKPNFITKNKTSGQVFLYNKKISNYSNKIILLEQADPGFDWIFSKNIKGFITKYGGANSHMSIRASETNTTAIVGVGEEIYNKILKMKSVFIDCQNQTISKI